MSLYNQSAQANEYESRHSYAANEVGISPVFVGRPNGKQRKARKLIGLLLRGSFELGFWSACLLTGSSQQPYGFVNIEVECAKTKNEIAFDTSMEPMSKKLEGTKWRSYIRKISDTKIGTGLQTSKDGKQFEPYGESILEEAEWGKNGTSLPRIVD